jgi:hypothetical protein
MVLSYAAGNTPHRTATGKTDIIEQLTEMSSSQLRSSCSRKASAQWYTGRKTPQVKQTKNAGTLPEHRPKDTGIQYQLDALKP